MLEQKKLILLGILFTAFPVVSFGEAVASGLEQGIVEEKQTKVPEKEFIGQLQESKNFEQEGRFIEAFQSAKKVFEDMISSGAMYFPVLDETLRLAGRVIVDKMRYDKSNAKQFCTEQIEILNRAGGIEYVIEQYRKQMPDDMQGAIDNRITEGHLFRAHTSVAEGRFDEADKDLSVLSRFSPINKQSIQDMIPRFRKLYLEDQDLVPLYRELSSVHLGYDAALDIANSLSDMYRRLEIHNVSDVQRTMSDLRKFGHSFFDSIFTPKGEIDPQHEHVLWTFLEVEGAGELLKDAFSKGYFSMQDYRWVFACNYGAYISYFLLKAKGLNVYCIQVKERKGHLSPLEAWFDKAGIIKTNKKIRENHVLNIVVFDDSFILVDLLNQHISGPFSLEKDLIKLSDKTYRFLSQYEYVNDFLILDPLETLAGIYFNWAGLFDTERKIAYYQKALEFNPTYSVVYSTVAGIMRDQGKIADAENLAKKALEIDSQDGLAPFVLAMIRYDRQDCAGAEQYLSQAIQVEPEFPALNLFAGHVAYSCERDIDKARIYIKKAIDLAEKKGEKSDAEEYRKALNDLR